MRLASNFTDHYDSAASRKIHQGLLGKWLKLYLGPNDPFYVFDHRDHNINDVRSLVFIMIDFQYPKVQIIPSIATLPHVPELWPLPISRTFILKNPDDTRSN
jgi:hypothetical protein